MKKRLGQLNYKEYMIMYHHSNDWTKIIPTLIWWKILPLSFLYLPIFFIMYPTVLPSTFDIAKLAQVDYKSTLLDTNMREKRKKYIKLITKSQQDFLAYRILVDENLKPQGYILSQTILSNSKLYLEERKLLLDNLSHNQLCAILSACALHPLTLIIWPNYFVRRKFIHHMKHIERGDILLAKMDLDILSKEELMEASLQRGLMISNLTEEELKDQLNGWVSISATDSRISQRVIFCAHGFGYENLRIIQIQRIPSKNST